MQGVVVIGVVVSGFAGMCAEGECCSCDDSQQGRGAHDGGERNSKLGDKSSDVTAGARVASLNERARKETKEQKRGASVETGVLVCGKAQVAVARGEERASGWLMEWPLSSDRQRSWQGLMGRSQELLRGLGGREV